MERAWNKAPYLIALAYALCMGSAMGQGSKPDLLYIWHEPGFSSKKFSNRPPTWYALPGERKTSLPAVQVYRGQVLIDDTNLPNSTRVKLLSNVRAEESASAGASASPVVPLAAVSTSAPPAMTDEPKVDLDALPSELSFDEARQACAAIPPKRRGFRLALLCTQVPLK